MDYTLYKSSLMGSAKERSQNTMRKRRNLLTYQQAKNFNTNYNFKTIQDYRQHVIDNNLNFLPKEPSGTYGRDGYKAYDFLGLDEAVYKANLQELQTKNCARMRSFLTEESNIKRSKSHLALHASKKQTAKPEVVSAPEVVEIPSVPSEQIVVNTIVGLDPDAVIKFLISEDVEPATIAKLVAEMDIHSSTLMNDLCKYMQERSKRQQATWRPTGYQTAEAQMSLKV